uniref:Uncharacterized protein n=1 Tax=viral metagenome TaxID=1070528 RepID=A0A6H1ZW42_9ZZZZ
MKEIKVISEGRKHRELIEVVKLGNGKKTSKTFHQTLVNGKWINNTNLKKKEKK